MWLYRLKQECEAIKIKSLFYEEDRYQSNFNPNEKFNLRHLLSHKGPNKRNGLTENLTYYRALGLR